ncbi:triosephosphate isomerase [Desulfacinum hydrothermale DSM 13146]|uniref:Triosephosphate isomerase n=1 Tax=Desulfacinum hydrothermale DSM 13146 TaxID=1121390 RepID=A0A1W1XS15_9BACT|nr:triose-phosphate isomerase [Desulfacinum hydrothermale]SMC26642.1 triosephosphate isomerase [Desulfacinum hydrothermale DSM 13146]
MTRKPLMAANWKMHLSIREAVDFIARLHEVVAGSEDREVLIAPPFTHLWAVREAMGAAGFSLAAQNCHWEEKGAFTGEISLPMLKEVGCGYVILGHSERRHIFGEPDEWVGLKTAAAFAHGVTPILCVGEKLEEREAQKTEEVLLRQLETGLAQAPAEQVASLVIAYEPVWAIGTGKTASPEQAQEAHAFIRGWLARRYQKEIAKNIRILYGGSVKPDNVDALMAQPDIDGALVGGASLDVASFGRIVRFQRMGETN